MTRTLALHACLLRWKKEREEEEEEEEEKNKMEGPAKTVAPPLKKAKGLADDTVVFAEAQSEGFGLKLTTLLARPEIASKGLDAQIVLAALRKAGGKVVEAKRALLDN
jgi:CO dehydrogenase/acetyl-CoA synthase beta subunit